MNMKNSRRADESYQAVGVAEELEVQEIAACLWKRFRAWRYENAEIALQICARHKDVRRRWEMISSENQARIALLKKAELEMEATGKLSEELKGRIFGDDICVELWKFAEEQVIEDTTRMVGLPLARI